MNKEQIQAMIKQAFIFGLDIGLTISKGKLKVALNLINHPNYKRSILYPTLGDTGDTTEDYNKMLGELEKEGYAERHFTSSILLETEATTLEYLETIETKGFKIGIGS